MPEQSNTLERSQVESLSVELAESVLADLAPEEIEILDITAAEYYADPEAVLKPRRREESLGFGLEIGLLTPYLLAVLGPVVEYVGSVVLATARQESRPKIEALVRRVFRPRRKPAAGDSTSKTTEGQPADPGMPGAGQLVLSREQARHVRDLANARARDAGLPEEQARLLANSLVGALFVDG